MNTTHSLPAACVLALGLVAVPVAGLARAPDLPAPPRARVQWVGSDVRLNGMPMRIRKFEVDRSEESVLRFYRRRWRRPQANDLPGYKEGVYGPWRIITRLEGKYLLSVQVQSSGAQRSWGYLGVSRIPDPKDLSALGAGFPRMRGSRVINQVTSRDPWKRGRTLVITNRFSVQSNANFYRNHFRNRGWTTKMDQALGPAHVFTFRQADGEVNLVISEADTGTQIVVNDVNTGL